MLSKRFFLIFVLMMVLASATFFHSFQFTMSLKGDTVVKSLQEDASIVKQSEYPSKLDLNQKIITAIGRKAVDDSVKLSKVTIRKVAEPSHDEPHVTEPRIKTTKSTTETPNKSSNNSEEYSYVVNPDSSNRPIKILLLSYQRSGSTLISSLIGDNPKNFFLFEPMDSLYSAMYGTSPGWNIPADIAIARDGSLRSMPPLERESVRNFIESLFNCDFDHVPTEFFVHPFFWYFKDWAAQIKPFFSCLKTRGLTERSLGLAQKALRTTCGQRFAESRNIKNKCFGKLWPSFSVKNASDSSVFGSIFKYDSARPYHQYISSMGQLQHKSSYCVKKYLSEPCQASRVRSMKTVRANMETAGDLLEKDPDVKVIHLLRDPRGATRSRIRATWSRGYYEGKSNERTAHAYCTQVLADVKLFHKLKKKYPDRILQMVLEDVMESPEKHIKEMYALLGLPLQSKVLNTFKSKVRKGFADKWKIALKPDFIAYINKTCAGYLQEIKR